VAQIRIDRQKCCECFLCEMICSLQYNPNAVNPKRSRIGAFFSKSSASRPASAMRCTWQPNKLV